MPTAGFKGMLNRFIGCVLWGLFVTGFAGQATLSLQLNATENILYQQGCKANSLLPCTLTLIAGTGTPVFLTITNQSSRTTARNIRAILPPSLSDVVQDASDCAQLLPLQSCQIALTPGNTVHPLTAVRVRGDNTANYDVFIQVVPNSYTVGGMVMGLVTNGLVLQNNGADNLAVTAGSTTFEFLTPIVAGGSYNVTVLTQPTGLFCTVMNGSGSNVMADVTNVAINCLPNSGLAFVTNYANSSNSVSLCQVNLVTGLFSSCAIELSTGLNLPSAITINPAITRVYIINSATMGYITRCDLNTVTGDLTNCANTGSFNTPNAIAFNLSGDRAYVAALGTGRVNLCTVDASGNLVGCAPTGPTFGLQLSSFVLNATATYAYISELSANSVYVCPVNTLTGQLSMSCTQTTGFSLPEGAALNPMDTFLYVTNDGTDNVRRCAVNAVNGSLSDCATTGPANLFSGFGKIGFNATGTKAYVPRFNSDTVFVCDVNAVNGALTGCVNSMGTGFVDPSGIVLF